MQARLGGATLWAGGVTDTAGEAEPTAGLALPEDLQVLQLRVVRHGRPCRQETFALMHEPIYDHFSSRRIFADRYIERPRGAAPVFTKSDSLPFSCNAIAAGEVIETHHINGQPIGRGKASPGYRTQQKFPAHAPGAQLKCLTNLLFD